MRAVLLFLFSALLVAACGGNDAANGGNQAAAADRARPAERNLVKIRDACVKYYENKKALPESTSDLEGFGAGEKDLEITDDYTDLAYSFFGLKFEAGKLVRGWFFASPKTPDALQLRMNGVTGKYEYLPKGEKWQPAEDDKGWAPGEEPKEEKGVKLGD